MKGWRRFTIADAWAPLPDLAAAEPDEREKGTPASTDPGTCARDRDLAEKDRPIDPMSGKKFVRKRARTGFEPNGQADGRQPFMPATVSQSLPSSLFPSFRPREADAAAFRRAREAPFHPATE